MSLISFASPKGGTGKTTLMANLAQSLHVLGYAVVALEFDPQNALRVHFGFSLQDDLGLSGAFVREDWSTLLRASSSGVQVLPFGDSSPAQRSALDNCLADPAFLARRLHSLSRIPGTLVLVDLPSGYSAALSAVTRLANLRLTTLLADPGSVAMLPLLRDHRYYGRAVAPGSQHRILLNKVDSRTRLSREIAGFMQQAHGEALAGVVHYDTFVKEAAAQQQLLTQSAVNSRAARDMQESARHIANLVMQIKAGGEAY